MKFIALLYFVLSLFGCDVGGSTYVTRDRIDGVDALYSRATTHAGVARFECLRSASGQCHYTLFRRGCAAAPAGKRRERCLSEPAERFAIARGDNREIAGLQDFRLCVSAEDAPPAPDCGQGEGGD